MTVVIVANPTSGRGKARGHSKRIAQALFHRNIKYTETEFGPAARQNSRFDPDRFEGARALIVCGGDGTINAVADAAVRTGTPVYHVPSGNACLFARQFGMRLKPKAIAKAIEKDRRTDVDLWWVTPGESGGGDSDRHSMSITGGIGPDAAIVRRFHERRRGPAGNAAYIVPILLEILRPTLPSLTVSIDDETVINNAKGWLLIANLRSYALGIDPCRDAVPDDGKLDAAFFPSTSIWQALLWAIRCRIGRQFKNPESTKAIGQRIVIRSESLMPLQIDGEHVGASTVWAFTRKETPMKVLQPV